MKNLLQLKEVPYEKQYERVTEFINGFTGYIYTLYP